MTNFDGLFEIAFPVDPTTPSLDGTVPVVASYGLGLCLIPACCWADGYRLPLGRELWRNHLLSCDVTTTFPCCLIFGGCIGATSPPTDSTF